MGTEGPVLGQKILPLLESLGRGNCLLGVLSREAMSPGLPGPPSGESLMESEVNMAGTGLSGEEGHPRSSYA